MAIKFENVEEEKQFEEKARLGIGSHLVKIVKVLTKNTFVDKNGNNYILIVFNDKDGLEHAETFFLGGSMAHRTSRLFKAIGLLEADEQIDKCKKEWDEDDILGAKLNITIEEDKNATNEKYKYKIAKEGFESVGNSKPKKIVEPVNEPWD